MPIYTKTGDKGQTSLFGGKRVSKADKRVDAYGSMDELNSWIGLLVAELPFLEKKEFLIKIQNDLFVIGSHLSGWKADLSVLQTRITEMEVEIDVMESEMPELHNFVLPGGTPLAAKAHVARVMTRNIERKMVALAKTSTVEPEILQYLNRLSDLFFDLARFINMKLDVPDVLWSGIPKDSRKLV